MFLKICSKYIQY